MPVLFLVAGLILIVTAIRGTTGSFAGRLRDDVSGGFLKWFAAILVVGALGYVPGLQTPSRYLLALVGLVILVTSGQGFISQFIQQIENPGTATTTAPPGGNANLPAIPVQTSSSGGGKPAAGGNAASPTGGISLGALASVAGALFPL